MKKIAPHSILLLLLILTGFQSDAVFNSTYRPIFMLRGEMESNVKLKGPESKGVYFAYGPVFNFFSVKNDGLTVKEFIDNGGNYVRLVPIAGLVAIVIAILTVSVQSWKTANQNPVKALRQNTNPKP